MASNNNGPYWELPERVLIANVARPDAGLVLLELIPEYEDMAELGDMAVAWYLREDRATE